jgi:hypothetical protein
LDSPRACLNKTRIIIHKKINALVLAKPPGADGVIVEDELQDSGSFTAWG